jgi:hypothetical protein
VKRAKFNTEDAAIQKQLADAQKEAQNAMGEFRSWGNPYYEKVWLGCCEGPAIRTRDFKTEDAMTARRQKRNAKLCRQKRHPLTNLKG